MREPIVINAETREITVPETERAFGVAGERNVEVKHIRIEGRTVDGTDLTQGFTWKVSCENAGKELCADLIDGIVADAGNIEFDWIVGAAPMAYKGTMHFAVCAVRVDAAGNILQEWHSKLGAGDVANGIEATIQNIGGQDLLAHIQSIAAAAQQNAAAAQRDAAAAAKSAEDAATSEGNAAASAKKAQTLVDGMPSDYSQAMAQISENKEAVNQLKGDKVDKPTAHDDGKIPRANNGDVEWVEVGQPTDKQTNSAVTKWLDEHPEATTTVQDNSLTINKMVIGTLGYITPEMFGAVGDGKTDDHSAIQAAIDYASNNGLTLVIPSKTYAVKETLNITKRVTIIGLTSPKMWLGNDPSPTLSFELSGTIPAIKIDYYKDSDYKDTTQTPNTDYINIKNLRLLGNDKSFCGIVTRCYLSDIENLTIERFTIGIYTHQTYKTNFNNVTTFHCDVGFFIGSGTNFNTNIIDCWCQYSSGIEEHTDASKVISNTLSEKFYHEKVTGIYVYNSACRLIRFSTEVVYYGIYAADKAKVIIDHCGIELIPEGGYGLVSGGELNPSTIICNDIVFWNNNLFTGKSASCEYRSTLIINNAAVTNFGEAKQSINSCLILKTVKGDRYVPIEVTGITGASITNNLSKFNGDGTFTYDFILNYTNHDDAIPIKITGGPTLGVTGDVIVFNSNYEQLHFYSDYGTLTTTSSHETFAYPASGTRLCFTVKYNFK